MRLWQKRTNPTKLRNFQAQDIDDCLAVFDAAVRHGTTDFYDAAQRNAWAGIDPGSDQTRQAWIDRLGDQHTIVATQSKKAIGFMTLGADGHIDFAYVHANYARLGVGQQLYNACIKRAQSLGLEHLTTEASHLARRFFEKQGWRVDAAQCVIRHSVAIPNFRMSIDLAPDLNRIDERAE